MNRLREVEPGNRQDVETVTELHMELLNFGPMAALGKAFIRELCYAAPLRDRVLKIALYEVEGRPAGFVAYTPESITFHRTLLRNHWVSAGRVLTLSILQDPRRLLRLPRAVRVVFSRRAEQSQEKDPLAEIVSLCVRPEYLTPEFVRRTGLRMGEELVSHAASFFTRAGFRKMRMIVDGDNKQALLFYHRLGGRFESYEQAGEPRTLVWLDVSPDPAAALFPVDCPACRPLERQVRESSESETKGVDGQYAEVNYLQFRGSRWLRLARSIAGVLTWPLTWPLAMVSRTSDILFRTASELLSIVPYLFGVVVRGEFYQFALRRCGKNVIIEFGTVFLYRDVAIGNHVLIGRYNTIHHCDFGSYVLTAEHSSFLSGSKYHNYDRTEIPMALQGGQKKRISIGNDCWIGAHAVVMEDVAQGAIVGAGAVVTKPVPEYTIVVGNPARPIRRRGEVQIRTVKREAECASR